MCVTGFVTGCRRTTWLVATLAAALLPATAFAQTPHRGSAYRGSAYRVAQAPATRLTIPAAVGGRDNHDGEALLVAPLPAEVETGEQLVEAEQLPQGYQVPLRQPADGLVIQAEDGLISLAARGAAVADVLTALAELQGLNLITQDSVTGTLNTTLNRVPIQDALDVILEMTGHTWTRNKNIILVTSVNQTRTLSPGAQGRQVAVFGLRGGGRCKRGREQYAVRRRHRVGCVERQR